MQSDSFSSTRSQPGDRGYQSLRYPSRLEPQRRSAINHLQNPKDNQLLAALPDKEWRRWQASLEWVDLPLGKVLYESGETIGHVYFPTTAVVALLYAMENGASAEIAVVGNEGIVGIALFMGGQSTPSRAVVQCAGAGFRLDARLMRNEFSRVGPVLHLLLRYTDALIAQMTLTAACNRHHSSEQQQCRWLLFSLDHLGVNKRETTQIQIANMLDARREHLTAYPHALHQAGTFRYARGHITLLDREVLERRSCECYAAIKKEYGRLLPPRMVNQ